MLKGKKIIITSPEESAYKISDYIQERQGTPILMPLVKIEPVEYVVLPKNMGIYQWVIFTSANAVDAFMDIIEQHQVKLPDPLFVAAIGEKTAEALKEYDWECNFISKGKSSADFAKEFLDFEPNPFRILFPCGNLASDTIVNKLGHLHQVDKLVVYNTELANEVEGKYRQMVETGQFDMILFTSPSAVQAYHGLFSDWYPEKTAALGTTTTKELEKHDVVPAVVASKSSFGTLIKEVRDYLKNLEK